MSTIQQMIDPAASTNMYSRSHVLMTKAGASSRTSCAQRIQKSQRKKFSAAVSRVYPIAYMVPISNPAPTCGWRSYHGCASRISPSLNQFYPRRQA